MNKENFLFLLLLLSAFVGEAQRQQQRRHHHICGTEPTDAEQHVLERALGAHRSNNLKNVHLSRSLKAVNKTYTIPVQFVVFEAEDGRGSNLTDAKIKNKLLGNLQHGFRDTPFAFELMEPVGIQRARNDSFFKCDESLELEFKSKFRQGGMETLNVFVCNLFAMGRFGIYGQAKLPAKPFNPRDGVLLMNPVLPKQGVSMLLLQNLLIHEVGHWMGLYHTFEVRAGEHLNSFTDYSHELTTLSK